MENVGLVCPLWYLIPHEPCIVYAFCSHTSICLDSCMIAWEHNTEARNGWCAVPGTKGARQNGRVPFVAPYVLFCVPTLFALTDILHAPMYRRSSATRAYAPTWCTTRRSGTCAPAVASLGMVTANRWSPGTWSASLTGPSLSDITIQFWFASPSIFVHRSRLLLVYLLSTLPRLRPLFTLRFPPVPVIPVRCLSNDSLSFLSPCNFTAPSCFAHPQ